MLFRYSLFRSWLIASLCLVPALAFADEAPSALNELGQIASLVSAVFAHNWPLALTVAMGLVGWGLLTAGAIGKFRAWVNAVLKPLHLNTRSKLINAAGDAFGGALEDIVKAEVNGPLLDRCASALANGGGPAALGIILKNELPGFINLSSQHVGAAISSTLVAELGQDAANSKVAAIALAAVHDHVMEQLAAGYKPSAPLEPPRVIEKLPEVNPGGPSKIVKPGEKGQARVQSAIALCCFGLMAFMLGCAALRADVAKVISPNETVELEDCGKAETAQAESMIEADAVQLLQKFTWAEVGADVLSLAKTAGTPATTCALGVVAANEAAKLAGVDGGASNADAAAVTAKLNMIERCFAMLGHRPKLGTVKSKN